MKRIAASLTCALFGVTAGFLLASASGLFGETSWLNAIATKSFQGGLGLFLAGTAAVTYRLMAWID